MGMNPDDPKMLSKIFDRVGIEPADISELSIADMSKIIESLNDIAPKIREGNENMSEIRNSKNYYLKSVFKYSIISKNKIYKKVYKN